MQSTSDPHSFIFTAPTICNRLPTSLHFSTFTSTHCIADKTHMFSPYISCPHSIWIGIRYSLPPLSSGCMLLDMIYAPPWFIGGGEANRLLNPHTVVTLPNHTNCYTMKESNGKFWKFLHREAGNYFTWLQWKAPPHLKAKVEKLPSFSEAWLQQWATARKNPIVPRFA